MTQQITLPRTIVEQLVGALETGADLARNHAEDVHESYKGYFPERHAAADRDVADITDAITTIRAALANAEPKKQYAWVCNECGSQEYTMAVSESDVHDLGCSRCGSSEWHKA